MIVKPDWPRMDDVALLYEAEHGSEEAAAELRRRYPEDEDD